MSKFLFITEHSPFEPTNGPEQRTNLLLEALLQLGEVDLVCFSQRPPPADHGYAGCYVRFFGCLPGENQQPRLRHIFWRFFDPHNMTPINPGYRQVVQELMQQHQYDHIVVRYVAPLYSCGLLHRQDLIIDVDDLPHHVYQTLACSSYLPLNKRLSYAYAALHAWYHNRKIMKRAGHIFFSNADHARLPNASALPNIPFSAPPEEEGTEETGGDILFVGFLDWKPNQLGVDRFLRRIWPMILQEIPSARFFIAGKLSDGELRRRWEKLAGVKLLGFVPSLEAMYHSSSLVVVPVYQGSGTNIKVVEAMQQRKAAVISPHAARGLQHLLQPGENILIARNDRRFAKAVISLLKHPERRKQMARAAQLTIQTRLTRETFNAAFRQAINATT